MGEIILKTNDLTVDFKVKRNAFGKADRLSAVQNVNIEIRKGEAIKVNGEIIGNHTKAKVVKNKLAPPFKVAEFDIMYGEGISREGELLDMAVEAEVVQKAGAWFSYKTQRLGQGRDKVKELFRTDPELAKQIEDELWANIDKLYAKSMPKSKAKAAAAAETKAEEPAPEEKPAAKKASSSKAASSKPVNIDIMVEE